MFVSIHPFTFLTYEYGIFCSILLTCIHYQTFIFLFFKIMLEPFSEIIFYFFFFCFFSSLNVIKFCFDKLFSKNFSIYWFEYAGRLHIVYIHEQGFLKLIVKGLWSITKQAQFHHTILDSNGIFKTSQRIQYKCFSPKPSLFELLVIEEIDMHTNQEKSVVHKMNVDIDANQKEVQKL